MSWSKEPQVNHNSDNCNFLNCIMIHESVLLPIVNDTPQWWNTGLLDLNVAQSMLLRGNIIHFKWWFISVWSGSCYVLMRCSLTWTSFDLRIMKSRLNWADDVSRQPIRGKKRMSCKIQFAYAECKTDYLLYDLQFLCVWWTPQCERPPLLRGSEWRVFCTNNVPLKTDVNLRRRLFW